MDVNELTFQDACRDLYAAAGAALNSAQSFEQSVQTFLILSETILGRVLTLEELDSLTAKLRRKTLG